VRCKHTHAEFENDREGRKFYGAPATCHQYVITVHGSQFLAIVLKMMFIILVSLNQRYSPMALIADSYLCLILSSVRCSSLRYSKSETRPGAPDPAPVTFVKQDVDSFPGYRLVSLTDQAHTLESTSISTHTTTVYRVPIKLQLNEVQC